MILVNKDISFLRCNAFQLFMPCKNKIQMAISDLNEDLVKGAMPPKFSVAFLMVIILPIAGNLH